MVYIPGLTLSRLIEESGPLATEQLIPFANQLLEIIANIHAQGVVHRDIERANIMKSPMGPRLIDFGIADFPRSHGRLATDLINVAFKRNYSEPMPCSRKPRRYCSRASSSPKSCWYSASCSTGFTRCNLDLTCSTWRVVSSSCSRASMELA